MKKYSPIIFILIFIIGLFIWLKFSYISDTPTNTPPEAVSQIPATPILANPILEPVEDKSLFYIINLTSEKPGAELLAITGSIANTFTTLSINRIDDKNLRQGMSLVVPRSFDDATLWEFMPPSLDTAQIISKLIIISQEMQSFGIYENGLLVRSGPVSSGKKSTTTPSRLYFMNWKGEEVISTFNDEWILKWNFNLDNKLGVSLHHYALPGYPASHSCVRLYLADAEWIYNWADQWILSEDGQTKIISGTPVIIYGEYNFQKQAPWKDLPENPNATKIYKNDLEELVQENLSKILEEQTKREQMISN